MRQVLIIDDNPLFRLGLRELFKTARPDLEVLETESFAAARVLLRTTFDIALVMIDIEVHGCAGFVSLFQLRSEFPQIPIIVVSTIVDLGIRE